MNYYKQIAEMLGVELGEEFSLKNNQTDELNRSIYKITQEKGLMYSIERMKLDRSTLILPILIGDLSVVKLPWKPQKNECYWHYALEYDDVILWKWLNKSSDFALWETGNCFRTKEEAKTKGKEIMEQIQKEFEEA